MNETQQSVSLIPEGVDVSTYMLHTPLEIGYALRTLAQKHDLISVYIDHGHTSFLSTILDVDTKSSTFWFDATGVVKINEKVEESQRVVFVAAPEGVKIQFVLQQGGVRLIDYEDGPAFSAPFPEDMIKLQRREFFRLQTPIGKPITCRIPHPSGKNIDLSLHDISIGGLGMWLAGAVPIDLLDHYPHCSLDLGTMGVIEFTLEIRSKRQVTQRNGTVQTLVGCRFVDLPRNVENILQRFIAHMERERHQLLKK